MVVGRIVGARGLDGTLKIETGVTAGELRGEGVRLFLGRMIAGKPVAERPVLIEAVSRWRSGLAVRAAGITGREEAEAVTGWLLMAENLAPAPGTYLFAQLRGLPVRSPGGESLGTVSDILTTGGHDLLVVTRDGREWYLPMVGAMILSIDTEGEGITAEVPEGLLDLNP